MASRPTSVKRASTTPPAVRHLAGSLSSARKSGTATAPCLNAASLPLESQSGTVTTCASGGSAACERSKRCWTICSTCRTCSARGFSCSCARALGQLTPCATSRQRTYGRTPRDATEPCARRCTNASESQRSKASLSRPRPGRLQQRPRRRAGWACSLPCALRRPPTGVPGRTR